VALLSAINPRRRFRRPKSVRLWKTKQNQGYRGIRQKGKMSRKREKDAFNSVTFLVRQSKLIQKTALTTIQRSVHFCSDPMLADGRDACMLERLFPLDKKVTSQSWLIRLSKTGVLYFSFSLQILEVKQSGWLCCYLNKWNYC
jgi:hypothetical protein